MRIVWAMVVALALLPAGCAQKCVCPAAPGVATSPQPSDTKYGISAPNPQAAPTEADLLAQARYEVARLDTGAVDWSVIAHHPNKYVRAAALRRLLPDAATLTLAQLERVAGVLGDGAEIYSPSCAAELSYGSPAPFAAMPSRCPQEAQRLSERADEVLGEAPPDRVIRAIVAHLARADVPVLGAFTLGYMGYGDTPLARRVRADAAIVPYDLLASVLAALGRATPAQQGELLLALAFAPLGSGRTEPIDPVVALQSSQHPDIAMLAAACVLVLTDQAGEQAAPVETEPRKTAAALLRRALPGSFDSFALSDVLRRIGPAAEPLLDSMLDLLRRGQSDPLCARVSWIMARLVAKLGVRGRRASNDLFKLGRAFADSQDLDGHARHLERHASDVGGRVRQLDGRPRQVERRVRSSGGLAHLARGPRRITVRGSEEAPDQ